MAQCPNCKQEVPENHAYCPHCETNLTKNIYDRSVSMGGIWGGILLFAVLVILVFRIATSGDSLYDKGYDDGSEEIKSEFLYFISQKYKDGHKDGLNVAWYFEKGCQDKTNRLAPQYRDVQKYMEGYDFC